MKRLPSLAAVSLILGLVACGGGATHDLQVTVSVDADDCDNSKDVAEAKAATVTIYAAGEGTLTSAALADSEVVQAKGTLSARCELTTTLSDVPEHPEYLVTVEPGPPHPRAAYALDELKDADYSLDFDFSKTPY